MNGDFNKISSADNGVLVATIGNADNLFKSKEEIQKYLIELKQIYTVYSMLDATELTLGWNQKEGRFFIKEKGSKPEKTIFKDFLIKNKYWSPVC